MSRARLRSRSTQTATRQVEHPYFAVYVLLVSWQDDDLGVWTEIDQLELLFSEAYGYHVEQCHIPSQNADQVFSRDLGDFIQKYQSHRSLLIVYYAGHGFLNAARLSEWSCTSSSRSSRVKWYSHQRLLEDSIADVLLILDCCQPNGGGGSVRRLTGKQVFAACGFSSEAPGVGEHSFSRALIDELRKACTRPITMATLHHRVENRLRAWIPDFRGERRVGPVLSLMGEGGVPSPWIELVSYSVYPTNLIAVMGMTGSGKSSFINRICQTRFAEVGENQESMTKDAKHYNGVVNGQAVALIDTPGFDDTYLSDREILARIATYLADHYDSGRKLTGLIYLRDINLERMTGSALKNLDLFEALCGAENFKNVVFLTTKWDKTTSSYNHGPNRKALDHERDLVTKFWAPMIELGCQSPKRIGSDVDKTLQTVDPVSQIIVPMLRFRPTLLQIQRELGIQGLDLIDTAAGQRLDQDLEVFMTKAKTEQISILTAAKKNHQAKLVAALKEQAAISKQEYEAAKDDRDALRQDFEKVREDQAQRRAELFGFRILDQLDDYAAGANPDSFFRRYSATLASFGLVKACAFIWRKQGESEETIDDARDALPFVGRFDYI